MKKIFLLLIVSLALSCCEKDNPPKSITELDKLPPATQIGAQRIGCLLDGKAFMPKYYYDDVNCFYQYVIDSYNPNGGYFFSIGFFNRNVNHDFDGLAIGTNSKEIHQGETFQLLENIEGNASGEYLFFMKDPTIHDPNYYTTEYGPYYTSQAHTGELKITKLDEKTGIVSGTFWFDVEDSYGVIHQIREGRFDVHYTN